MTDVAVRVENLSKRYRIGGPNEAYGTLRDVLAGAVQQPFKRLRGQGRAKAQEFWALRDVSFEVKRGEVLGIIGRNGAGKSTLLKILSRITEPTCGHAEIYGRVGSLLEVGTGFHPELTGRENVYLNGAILGMTKREIDRRFDEIVEFSGVEQFLDTPVKRYSSGMYTRLAFSVAAHLEPEILIIDEVLAVGDAAFQKKSLGKMGDVAREGRTVLFVSHNMAAVRSLCHRAVALRNGAIVLAGDAAGVVDGYLSTVQTDSGTRDDAFPAMNTTYGIGIAMCTATVEHQPGAGDHQRLTVEVEICSAQPAGNIGVGMSLTASDGSRVSVLGPTVTNFIVDSIEDRRRCRIICDAIDSYLAGGDYVIGVWLARPRIEHLVRVEDAVRVTIGPRDLFSSGRFIESPRNGVVPLPLRFEQDSTQRATVPHVEMPSPLAEEKGD